jgi:hypothetical protein
MRIFMNACKCLRDFSFLLQKRKALLINSDDLYIQTHGKPQICPTSTTIPEHYTVVPNFVSKFSFEADQRTRKCHERKTCARHFWIKRRIYLTHLKFIFSYVIIQGTSFDSCQKFCFCSLYVIFFVTFWIHNSLPIQKARKSCNFKKTEVEFPLS